MPTPQNEPLPEPDPDVAASDGADPQAMLERFIPEDIRQRFEFYSYRNAALILSEAHPTEFGELMLCLRSFRLTTSTILEAGGNESAIPKIFSAFLRQLGWNETTIQGDLAVRLSWREEVISRSGKRKTKPVSKPFIKRNYLDGHKVDYVKGRVAFDLEWNSKDQTFDRDLYAFNAFNQCGVIDVAVLLTRSAALNPIFQALGVMNKYGASTTWMGKLLYRLNAGRAGGCPVLAIGIRPESISDWKQAHDA
jgi:hypothetical protein